MSGIDRIRALISDGAYYGILSLVVAGGLILFLPGIQKRWTYAAAGVVLGTLMGLAAQQFGVPGGLDIIATIIGFIAGPPTAAKWQGKTIPEAIEELRSVSISRRQPPAAPDRSEEIPDE